ncbi:MAG: DUF6623 family protein [Bacillota bacterium]|nr:DUF6623 family protein [Bacillota bacterium]
MKRMSMIAESSWIHGHSMQIEYSDRLELIRRAAYYIEVHGEAETTNWFHFAVPTPVTLNDDALKVGSVFIRYKTDGTDARIKQIHLYDGEKRIAEFNNLDLSSANWETVRFDPPELLTINFGLGVSCYVNFGSEGETPELKFSAAGCDFARTQNNTPATSKTGKSKSKTAKLKRTKKRR